MKSIKNLAQKLWNDESAQGATEYILLLVVVVAVVLLFKKQIMSAVSGQMTALTTQMGEVSSSSGQ
jgi:Flp pilus assembly pilin Flp